MPDHEDIGMSIRCALGLHATTVVSTDTSTKEVSLRVDPTDWNPDRETWKVTVTAYRCQRCGKEWTRTKERLVSRYC